MSAIDVSKGGHASEPIFGMLLIWSNTYYYQYPMAEIRFEIATNSFATFERNFRENRAEGDVPPL